MSEWIPNLQWIIAPIIGAILSAGGGFFAAFARLRLETGQEIDFVKISLNDELQEICSIISKMTETHRASGSIPKMYFDDLSENTDSFKQHKPRLFLVGSSDLRKEICDFYKDLTAEIKKSQNTVGTLNEVDAQTTVTTEVIANFTAIKSKAETLKTHIGNYKFKIFPVG